MHADPITHAEQHEAAAHNRTTDYHAALTAVESEIRSAFAQHFAGKPGIALPSVAYRENRDQVVYVNAQAAVQEAADYEETSAAFHALMTGVIRLDQFQAAIVERYIESNADDIVWARTGLTLPTKRTEFLGATVPKFLTMEAA